MNYNVFISHSWKHSNDYDRLVHLLEEYPYFVFRNYSVPKKDPLDIDGTNYRRKLRDAIIDQMRFCSCFIVIAGKYVNYSDSIDMEIDIAIELKKPIIAVEPWGSIATSQRANKVADRIVGWNASSVVNAIRELSR